MCIKKFGNVTYYSNGIDEFYIEKDINNAIILYHKNTKGNRRCWHIEDRHFENEQSAIEYCRKHKNKKSQGYKNFQNVERLLSKI